MPVLDDVEIPQLDIFPRPVTLADTMTVYNFCDYDLWLQPYIGSQIGSVEHIPAGGQLARPFSAADRDIGISLKVSKAEADFATPVQVEYTAAADGLVYYDLSLIDCLGRTVEVRHGKPVRNGNTSACAGHEAGLQLGSASAMSFQCGAGIWCDDQAYLYEVSQKPAPVNVHRYGADRPPLGEPVQECKPHISMRREQRSFDGILR